jgi:carbonic anhydrase
MKLFKGVRNRAREFLTTTEKGKPSNSLGGLRKHWKADMKSGFQVCWIAIAFALGISTLSEAPDVAGITTAIVAGLFMVFIGGSNVTITGPAAALAPFIAGAVMVLGAGDKAAGYPIVLVAICLAGAVQIVLALLGTAKLSSIFQMAVVEGMLAGIGLTILGKEMPHVLGKETKEFHAHHFHDYFTKSWECISTGDFDWHTVIIAVTGLIVLWALTSLHKRRQTTLKNNPDAKVRFGWFFALPPIGVVLMVGIAMGYSYGLTPQEMVHIPENLWEGFTFPNFAGAWDQWDKVLKISLTLVMVDGVESLATAEAIDKKDPYHRKSNPHRVLFAMGLFNLIGPLFGALTHIPGGLKSTANIHAGGRTLWANFFTTLFVIILVMGAQDLVNMIPYSTLAAILIFVGFQLFKPAVWVKLWKVGPEQVVCAAITALVTAFVDILWGLAAGFAFEQVLLYVHSFCRNPISRQERDGDVQHIWLNWNAVSINSFFIRDTLDAIPEEVKEVHIYTGPSTLIIDATTNALLVELADEWEASERGHLYIHHDESMVAKSGHPTGFMLRKVDAVGQRPKHTNGNGSNVLSVP